MADVAESAPFTDPATAISQGKRHLLVRDYTMAVTALAQACQLLAEKHGDTADELGEPYLLYGRALLGLAREEAGVLGGGVPGSEDAEDEDDGEDDEEEDKLSNVDEKDEEEEETAGGAEDSSTNGTASDSSQQKKVESSEKSQEISKNSEKVEKTEKSEEKKVEEKVKVTPEKPEKVEKSTADISDKDDAPKDAEKKGNVDKAQKAGSDDSVAGPSKEPGLANGVSSTVEQNGEGTENEEDGAEDINKEEDEDDVNNLQVAWEVLELAKLVLLKRGPPGWKLLADSYRLLGEVAMEGGNHQGALNDLEGCLNLLQKIEPREPRAIAEIHYQLGLAHSLGNDFDASIEQFRKATTLLESRINELEKITEPPKCDDPFYTIEGEIQELKDLLPEIQEKITDMKDFKQEACKLVIEGIKSKVSGGCSNGAGPSSDTSSTTCSTSKPQKPVSDISHLVRKKRKADDSDTEITSACKKPTPEKTV